MNKETQQNDCDYRCIQKAICELEGRSDEIKYDFSAAIEELKKSLKTIQCDRTG